MHFLLVGMNHTSAPIEVREQFALSLAQLPRMLSRLQQTKSILECVLISTCNRMEIYVVVDKLERGRDYLLRFVRTTFAVSEQLLAEHLYIREDDAVIEHLYRVTAGLDSMIIGETQILGQVRDFFLKAQACQATGVMFNTLFKDAITLAKRAHTETGIAEQSISIGHAAVQYAAQQLAGLAGKYVVIIGAGNMAEVAVKHLHALGPKRLAVVNRTLEHAQSLVASTQGTAHTLIELESLLIEADLVICSTGAEQWVLTKPQIEAIMNQRQQRHLMILDIALPRDAEPTIAEIANVVLHDLDDLRVLQDSLTEQRQVNIAKIESMIAAAVVAFKYWLKTLGVFPLIEALQAKAAVIHAETMDSLRNKLPDLSEREVRVMHKLSKSMLNQLMRDPILKLKELSDDSDGQAIRESFRQLFALQVQEDRSNHEEVSARTGNRTDSVAQSEE